MKVYGGTAEQLKSYRVGNIPPQDRWVEVEPSLFFKQVGSEYYRRVRSRKMVV